MSFTVEKIRKFVDEAIETKKKYIIITVKDDDSNMKIGLLISNNDFETFKNEWVEQSPYETGVIGLEYTEGIPDCQGGRWSMEVEE